MIKTYSQTIAHRLCKFKNDANSNNAENSFVRHGNINSFLSLKHVKICPVARLRSYLTSISDINTAWNVFEMCFIILFD